MKKIWIIMIMLVSLMTLGCQKELTQEEVCDMKWDNVVELCVSAQQMEAEAELVGYQLDNATSQSEIERLSDLMRDYYRQANEYRNEMNIVYQEIEKDCGPVTIEEFLERAPQCF